MSNTTIYHVCQKFLCDVYQVTPCRLKNYRKKLKQMQNWMTRGENTAVSHMPLLALLRMPSGYYKCTSKTEKPLQHGEFTETLLKP
jgi:hypothetical protein